MEYAIPAEVMNQTGSYGMGMEQNHMDSIIRSVSRSAKPANKKLPDPIDYLIEVMVERGLRNKD